jgi:hypothetical protein
VTALGGPPPSRRWRTPPSLPFGAGPDIWGRPGLDREVVSLIRRMAQANVTWGAPRIRNETAMLGIEVAVSTVAKYMPGGASRPLPPSASCLGS